MRHYARLAALLLTTCSASTPIEAVGSRVRAESTDVVLGKGFPVTVVRVWERGLEPEVWSDALLAPLAVKRVGVERREDGARVEETRRFLGYAFAAGEVTVPVGEGEPLSLEVRASLPPDDESAPELPAVPPRSRWWIWAGAGALLAAFLLLRRRPAEPVVIEEAAPAPVVLDRSLERLRALAPEAPRLHEEVAAIVREHVGRRCGIDAMRRTTEEVVRVCSGAGAVLRACDGVKFAREAPDRSARHALLADAAAFVESAP